MTAIVILYLAALQCSARLVEFTIDDTYGDARTGVKPQYAPDDAWGKLAVTTTSGTPRTFDSNQVHNQTLHSPRTWGAISLPFEGVSIKIFVVYDITSPVVPFTVYLDDDPAALGGNYTPAASQANGRYVYNQLAYQSRQLPQRRHTLRVEFQALAWTYFDYAMYT
ncbi:hypothetical protein AURDEDRAFT_164376 [Auricularia subglabra TFB-10046 SS5]|nr:hypothetical protein AURDEDRAFT_164376 [Auricularia subglabra TFB-10046 SS5]